MKKNIYRLIISIAVCSMFAAVLTYSRAMAENPGDVYEESNICTFDNTGTLAEAPAPSVVSPASDDVDTLSCTWGRCGACPEDHPAGPFFCNVINGCCAPY